MQEDVEEVSGSTDGLQWLDKQETAALLGVSARAVERYVRSGKLSVRYEPGRTRPSARYDADEVQTLINARRNEQASAERNVVTVENPSSILRVRLDPFYVTLLAEEANRRGLTSADYAARLLMGALEDHRQAAAEELRDEVTLLRENLATATEALLVAIGSGAAVSPEEARAWVTENLRDAGDDGWNPSDRYDS